MLTFNNQRDREMKRKTRRTKARRSEASNKKKSESASRRTRRTISHLNLQKIFLHKWKKQIQKKSQKRSRGECK